MRHFLRLTGGNMDIFGADGLLDSEAEQISVRTGGPVLSPVYRHGALDYHLGEEGRLMPDSSFRYGSFPLFAKRRPIRRGIMRAPDGCFILLAEQRLAAHAGCCFLPSSFMLPVFSSSKML